MTQKKTQAITKLYQERPFQRSTNPAWISPSFTESAQSYQKKAREETWILENNNRKPNHELILRYFVVLDVATIKANWKRLRMNLKRAGITFAATIELTLGVDGKPDNTVHYHFFIYSTLEGKKLKEAMQAVCLNSGLGVYGSDFDLIHLHNGIPDYGRNKIRYFTKYGYPHKVHLFVKGLRIKKFYYSSDWFVEPDGTTTTRAKILKRLKAEYKQKKSLKPSMQTLSTPCHTGFIPFSNNLVNGGN